MSHTPGEGKMEGVFKLHLNEDGVVGSRESIAPHVFSPEEQPTNLDIPKDTEEAHTVPEKITEQETYEAPKAFRDKINELIKKGKTLRVFRELDMDILHSPEALAERLKRYANPEIDGNLTEKEYEDTIALLGITTPVEIEESSSVEADTSAGSFVVEAPGVSAEEQEKENGLESLLTSARDEYAELSAQWQSTLTNKERKYAQTMAALDSNKSAPKFEEPKELQDARREYQKAKNDLMISIKHADDKFDEESWLLDEHTLLQNKKTEYIRNGSKKILVKALDSFSNMSEDLQLESGSNILAGNFDADKKEKVTYDGFRSPDRGTAKKADVLPFQKKAAPEKPVEAPVPKTQEEVKAKLHSTGIGFSGETFIEGVEKLKTEIKNLYANEPMPEFIQTNILNRPNFEIVQEFKIPADSKIEKGQLSLDNSGNLVYKHANGSKDTVVLNKKTIQSSNVFEFTGSRFIPEPIVEKSVEPEVAEQVHVPETQPEIAVETAQEVSHVVAEVATPGEAPKTEVGITPIEIPFEKGKMIQVIVEEDRVVVALNGTQIAEGPKGGKIELLKGIKKGWLLKTDEEKALEHIQPMLATLKA